MRADPAQLVAQRATGARHGAAGHATQTSQHDADLFLRRKLSAGRAPDLLHNHALPVPSPARISVPSALLQWLRWARNPCNLASRPTDIGDGAVAGERPKNLWAAEPARECVPSPAVPSNPNSRLGRDRSPFAQGWDRMDAMVVGIDVSKDWLDVALRPTGESFVFKRTPAGIEDLVERLKDLSPALVAIEATGGFEAVVAAALAGAGLPVVVVNPAQVRAFAVALGKRAKTDPIDAAVIAHFGEATKPQLRQLPDEMTRLLADLIARRRQIVEMLAAEGQRARRISDHRLTRSIARLRKALESELAELERLIGDHMRGSTVWVEKEKLLASVRGVEKPTPPTLIAELPDLGSLDRRQTAPFVGLAPWTRQSGRWRGKSFIG